MRFCCLTGNWISVHRSLSRSTDQEGPLRNIPVWSSSWGSFLLQSCPNVPKPRQRRGRPRGYFTREALLQRLATSRGVPASGDSVIKLKQVHVIRCCSRAPVLMPLMMSGRAFSCGEVVISGLQLKTIDRFSHHCRRRLGGRKKCKIRNFRATFKRLQVAEASGRESASVRSGLINSLASFGSELASATLANLARRIQSKSGAPR